MDPVSLLIRNKPCGVDAFELAIDYNCAFVGYAAIRKPSRGVEQTVFDRILPFEGPGSDWPSTEQFSRNTTKHKNFVQSLTRNKSILVMPRMTEGTLYLGRYIGFEFHKRPEWLEDFRKRCESSPELNDEDRDSSVCQILRVDHWKPVPFVSVPAWIRKSVFGRSSMHRIHDVNGMSAFSALDQLLSGNQADVWDWTENIEAVKGRLLQAIGPSSFEHLMVSLLQLEEPSVRWLHVGGSGDGGVDGLGVSADGTNNLLQCKWQYDGKPVKAEARSVPLHIASLYGERTSETPPHVTFWGPDRIAELVIKHAGRLPIAYTLRIRTHATG